MGVDANWTALLRSSLDGAHAERFGSAPAALIERARTSVLGRRALACRLQNQAPQLFAVGSAGDCSWAALHPWAFFSGERLRGSAFDLGALAFAPALRTRVNRDEVLLLREAIGAARIGFALSTDPWAGAVPEAVRHCAMTGLARLLDEPGGEVAERVRQRGRIELYAYAAQLHPLLGERVKLAFAPSHSGERSDAWLPATAVAHYLAAAGSTAAEVRQ